MAEARHQFESHTVKHRHQELTSAHTSQSTLAVQASVVTSKEWTPNIKGDLVSVSDAPRSDNIIYTLDLHTINTSQSRRRISEQQQTSLTSRTSISGLCQLPARTYLQKTLSPVLQYHIRPWGIWSCISPETEGNGSGSPSATPQCRHSRPNWGGRHSTSHQDRIRTISIPPSLVSHCLGRFPRKKVRATQAGQQTACAGLQRSLRVPLEGIRSQATVLACNDVSGYPPPAGEHQNALCLP